MTPAEPMGAASPVDRGELQIAYRQLYLIRRFEERTAELFAAGVVTGTAHSCIGQEAIAVGTASALRADDYIVGHHRSHGHLIAKGADVRRMMAELMGRSSGYCRGLGGSMHIADIELGVLGCNGIVGAGLPIGCGSALSAQLRGSGQVTVVFFGDGAVNQGLTHEAMNLASVWQLPVVFVCENNQFALSTEWREVRAVESIAERAAAYGMPGATVDGNDVVAVRTAAEAAVRRARDGNGPTLIEATTYRRMQHSMRTNLPDRRDPHEEEVWTRRDPVARVESALLELGVEAELLGAVRDGVDAELEDAIRWAEGEPVVGEGELDDVVYVPHAPERSSPTSSERPLDFYGAVREALRLEMEVDESVVVIGEDVGRLGGIFRATEGLWEQFGEARVRNTPISEGGFVGMAVGAALTGLRPVVELQIFDFVTLAADAIVNQAAKLRFMTGGAVHVPLVVRGPSGGGIRLAAQHSQSLEAWFAHIPGLVVVAPSSPADAKGLLAAAIRDDNPVVFLEAKSLLFGESPVPEGPYVLPLGKADVKRAGSDVTVVATQALVPAALRAAERLHHEGTSVEVIDPRTLYPLDLDTILESVAKTGRIVIAHEAVQFCGIGAEIAAAVAQHGFWNLDAPIVRVGAPHRPVPYQKDLEQSTLPGTEAVVQAIRSLQ